MIKGKKTLLATNVCGIQSVNTMLNFESDGLQQQETMLLTTPGRSGTKAKVIQFTQTL